MAAAAIAATATAVPAAGYIKYKRFKIDQRCCSHLKMKAGSKFDSH